MSIDIVITNAGRAAIVNAQNTGTASVTIAHFGLSQSAVAPTATATALAGEFKRISAFSGEVVADDTIHLTMTDETADEYALRSFALYLADGTLFAIYGQAAPIYNKVSSSIGALSLDVIFADISAATLSFGNANFTNPPATTERLGVVELATVPEAQAGIDALRALTPASARAAILGWLLAQDGSGSGLDADLLDGQQGSYYTNIAARLGFSPANKAGDIFTGDIEVRRAGTQQIMLNGAGQASWRLISEANGATPGRIVLQYSSDRFAANFVNALEATPGGSLSGAVQGTLWGAANDGSGSGLDADLLDGQDGSYYSNITARLGYTPLNSTVYTAADVRGKLLTVDGSGSGIDADLLDGEDGSFYSNIPARLGYTPANRAGDIFTGDVEIRRSPTQQLLFNGGGQLSWRLISTVQGATPGNVVLQYSTDRFASNFVSALTASPTGFLTSEGQGELWGAANDGSGSGLDADLLDGQDGSYYANVIARLGYTPLNSTAYTAADVRAKLLTVDGSGSGVDADLLDGQDGSYYSNVVARLGYSPINKAGDIFTGDIEIRRTPTQQIVLSGGEQPAWRVISTVNGATPGNFVLQYSADRFTSNFVNALDATPAGLLSSNSQGTLWGSANDGAGSGLDADLLDGLQADAFARRDGSSTITGPLRVQSSNQALFRYSSASSPTVIHRNDGSSFHILISAAETAFSGTFNALRPLSIDLTSGQFKSSNGQNFSGGLVSSAVIKRDDAFYFDIWGSNPIVNFDANDYVLFDRANNIFRLIIDGQARIIAPLVGNMDFYSSTGNAFVNGSMLWHAGNDGAGSGLDADLLDGYHAADLLPTGSLDSTGYCRLPNGLIMQWGTVYCNANAYGSVTFPILFPTACFHIHSGVATEVGNGEAQANCPLPYSVTKDGASFWNAAPAASAWWMAIGK